MPKSFKATIIGRVQMVMYRDFAQRKARKLGLVGTVRNVNDGTVEVVAEGEEDKLGQYLEYLRKGSILSKVSGVSVEWGNYSGKYSDFLIIY